MTTSHKLGPGSLKFGAVGSEQEFAAQLTNARLEPSYEREDAINVLDGGEVEGDETITWTVSGTLLQSFDAASLVKWCHANQKTTVPFTFLPSDLSADKWTGECRIVPVTIGGDVKARNTSDFEFAVKGDVTPVAAGAI